MSMKITIAKSMIGILILLASASFSYSGESASRTYSDLDKIIIKAYNSDPRNTADVYASSMQILEKASKEEDSSGAAWLLKARKLITVSCYYECTQAIDKKLYRQAFVWAKRGEKNGTSLGKIGEVPVKNLYDYLTFASNELKEIPVVKNSSPEELSMRSDDPDLGKIELQLHELIFRGAILTAKLHLCSSIEEFPCLNYIVNQ
jgi:hypothetical protein